MDYTIRNGRGVWKNVADCSIHKYWWITNYTICNAFL